MPGSNKWKMTLYGSNTKTAVGSTPDTYGMKTIAISGLTTASSKAVFILAPEEKPEITSEKITDVGGEAITYITRRGTFTVECFPFNYDATSDALLQDMEDLRALTDIISGFDYHYVRIEAGSRTYPSTSATCYPVTVDNYEESLNKAAGVRNLVLTLAHRVKS